MYAAFQTKHEVYLAMEYCPGGNLREFMDAIGVLDENEAKQWFAQMIVAVNALHDMGFIHRDLKPENFFIDAKGHIKLGDFGLSKETKLKQLDPLDLKRQNRLTLATRVEKFETKERLTSNNFSIRFPLARNSRVTPKPACRVHATPAMRILGADKALQKPNNIVRPGML